MQRLQAYKFELMPDGEQTRKMRQFAGSCRFVFNKALASQNASYRAGGKFVGYVPMAKNLTAWRNSGETPWLADTPSAAQQQTLKDLDRAYANFFAKRAEFPRFKRKGQCVDSFRCPDKKAIKLDQANGRISLAKLGWIRYRKSRDVLGEVRSVTVSSRDGKWYASILTQCEVEQPLPTATGAVGIDVGVARFATLSDGTYVAAIDCFKNHEKRLAKYQRRMSRKTKFSSNWKKAKARVQRIHADIANARNDFLHKFTTAISKNHAMVVVEDLQVGNMSKSSKGTQHAPGKNVRAKSGLNKSILDQGWGEFRRQLAYKASWSGAILIAVPAHNTSRTCPCCGHIAKENRKTQASFLCVSCGHANHADRVGALNILARGLKTLEGPDLARIACAESSPEVRASWQEPTEATHAALA